MRRSLGTDRLSVIFRGFPLSRVIEINLAHAVREPIHVMQKGRKPVLTSKEARGLLDSSDTYSLISLPDRTDWHDGVQLPVHQHRA